MMYTMPKNLLSICVNFALATQRILADRCVDRKGFSLYAEIQTGRKISAKRRGSAIGACARSRSFNCAVLP